MDKKKSFVFFVLLVVVLGVIFSYTTEYGKKTRKYLLESSSITAGNSSVSNLNGLTTALLRSTKDYEEASGPNKEALLLKLKDNAARRKQAMLSTASSNPEAFILTALPQKVVDRLPGDISELVEQDKEAKGKLTVYHVDMFDESESYFSYVLEDEYSGEEYELHFARGSTALLSGSTVKVRGKSLDNKIVLAEAGGTSFETVYAAEALTTNNLQTLVMLINFSDNTTQPFTRDQVNQIIFGSSGNSLNTYYQDNSFQKIGFSGDIVNWNGKGSTTVTDWYTIPNSTATKCDTTTYRNWASAADSAAVKAGYATTSAKRIYIFPRANGCPGAGWGTLGGSQTWSNGYGGINSYDYLLFTHELGHNLGVHHAQSISCGTKSIDAYGNCTIAEYGDPSDTMGGWNSGHFNSGHKSAVGWISPAQIQTVTADGTFTISAIETWDASVKAIKVAKKNTNEWYYLTYRQPIGFDRNIDPQFFNGASINIWNGSGSVQTKLVDVNPGWTGGTYDSALADGKTFQDTINGLSITQLSHNSTTATVQVSFGAVPCIKSTPLVTVSPVTQTGAEWSTLTYTLSVTNNDTATCPLTNFSFGITNLPSGFSASTSQSILTIAPGSSGSTQVLVTSPTGAQNGSYTFNVKASDNADALHANTASATYVAYTPVVDTAAPVVAITSPVTGSTISGKSVSIEVTATDNIWIAKVEIYIDGSLKITDTATPYNYKWTINPKVSAGAHTIIAKAYDTSGNTSSASITVNK